MLGEIIKLIILTIIIIAIVRIIKEINEIKEGLSFQPSFNIQQQKSKNNNFKFKK